MPRVRIKEALELLRVEVEEATAGDGVLRVSAGRLRLRAGVRVEPEGAFLAEEATGQELDVELEVYPAHD